MEFESHPVPRSALLFMAMVEEARSTNEGPFRAIAPVFRLALEPQRGRVLNLEDAAKALSPIFGDNFTQHTVEAFLPQLASLGWLVPELAADRVAYRVPSSLPAFDADQAVEASSTRLDRIYAAFQEFLDATAPLLRITLSREEFHWQLFSWSTSLDGADKEAVKAQAARIAEGERPLAKNAYLDEPQKFSRIDKGLSVEFAGFVKWLVKYKRQELSDIASLTELGLALEFLEEIRNPTARKEVNVDATFVLDAPVLLDLFGLSGHSRQESIKRCLDSLKVHGGRLATLSHCLQELADVIKTVLGRPAAMRYGLTGDALRADPSLSQVATRVARQPDNAARAAGVEVLHFDPDAPLYASHFPAHLIDRFRNTATWHDLDKTEQRERDAMSIAFVMRRRHGEYHSDVLDNNFVLVARNATFTNFSERFVRRELKVPDYAFGPAIETKTLAALVWMRFGSEADPDLPQVHLISACDRILASNRELLRKAERKLSELKGTDAANALLASQQAVLDLVISVGGSHDVLDAANGEELLRAFTATANEEGRREERAKADLELEAIRAESALQEKRVKEERERAAELATDSLRKDREIREAADALNARNLADQQRAKITAGRLGRTAERTAWRVVTSAWLVCAVVGLTGQFFVWQGPSWWLAGQGRFLAGSLVVLCSAIAVVFSLRFIPPGRLDVAAVLQARLARHRIIVALREVEPTDERDRVREALRAEGLI